jgi:hypothetical protein
VYYFYHFPASILKLTSVTKSVNICLSLSFSFQGFKEVDNPAAEVFNVR